MTENNDIYNAYKGLPKEDLNDSFITACKWGRLEQVKCLLENQEFSKYIDVHYKDDEAFVWSLVNSKREIFSYLIHEYRIEKTDRIKECLSNSISDVVDDAAQMFEMRELNERLNEDLTPNNQNSKKAKI
jgi:hypothetical protein